MLAKGRIVIIDAMDDDNKQKINELETKIAELEAELKICRDRAREYEIERRTLVTLNNIYKDMFPDCDLVIDIVPKAQKSRKVKPSDKKAADAVAQGKSKEEVAEIIAAVFK